jgi:fluoroquinolone transport system permease protein
MHGNFVGSEMKKWLRDPLMRFMMFYPIIFGLIGRYFLPWIADASGFALEHFADLILVILTLLISDAYGALAGFSILEDRDDHILTAIKVTPLSIHGFLAIRLVLVFLLAFVAAIYVMWFSAIGALPVGNIVAIAFLVALGAPMTGLLINALSQNKIEGFAVMKGVGTILIFPFVSLFFVDGKELFFAFAPGFWPAKAISSLIRGEGVLFLSFQQYYLIGLVYNLVLNGVIYKVFLQRTKT